VHRRQQVRGAKRPAFRQDQVVDVFETDACDLAEDIERIEDLLQVHQPHIPSAILRIDDGLQGNGRAPVPSTGIEEEEIERRPL